MLIKYEKIYYDIAILPKARDEVGEGVSQASHIRRRCIYDTYLSSNSM
jgi:hypothetical protein